MSDTTERGDALDRIEQNNLEIQRAEKSRMIAERENRKSQLLSELESIDRDIDHGLAPGIAATFCLGFLAGVLVALAVT